MRGCIFFCSFTFSFRDEYRLFLFSFSLLLNVFVIYVFYRLRRRLSRLFHYFFSLPLFMQFHFLTIIQKCV